MLIKFLISHFQATISVIDGWGINCEIALKWIPLDLTDDESILVQVMAWCRQATSHYLSQCWPRSHHHMASLGHNELSAALLPGNIKNIFVFFIISRQWNDTGYWNRSLKVKASLSCIANAMAVDGLSYARSQGISNHPIDPVLEYILISAPEGWPHWYLDIS